MRLHFAIPSAFLLIRVSLLCLNTTFNMAGPKFLGADLLGDSMLLRYSLRYADDIPNFGGYPSFWGMCRSGKAAEELLTENWNFPDGPHYKERAVVIMIGTNDLLQISQATDGHAKPKKALRHTLKKIRVKAVRKFKHVYFCTVPEIPRLAEDSNETTRERYHSLLTTINKDIMAFGDRCEEVTSIDLRGMFGRDCYERFMGRGGSKRRDDIHLNDNGQAVLRRILKEKIQH